MTDTHPVDELAQHRFDDAARAVADDLRCRYSAYYVLEPGDATRYEISIVATAPPRRYYLATSFGPLYQWHPSNGYTSWDYVLEHWLDGKRSSDPWTARVIARFLNALREEMLSNG